jgi:membrane fusion protein, copper/silver efflux system
MSRGAGLLTAAIAVAIGIGAGYWWGMRTQSAGPAQVAADAASPSPTNVKAERKILYYRNPMGLSDTSPVPKKDPMGMDYVAVYDGEEPETASNQIKISVDKVQKLGVRSEPAVMRSLDKVVKAAGRIEVDERRVFAIAPKFEGWVERLFVNATGQPVSKGQPLFEVYSPELVSAQREYTIAAEAVKALKDAGDDPQASMKRLADSSLTRLKNWDISEEQVRALAQSGETRRTLTFRSPVSGIVMEKKAVQGMRFMPGDSLYQVADLSAVWVVADVFEQDIALVRTGSKAKVSISAYPDRSFEGTITYVYPTLKAETRTVPVRLEIANPRQLLKPAMFAQVDLPVGGKAKVLTVPNSAVIDSGTRRIVLVQLAEGRFEPREVKLGSRTDTYVEVMDGVKEGEQVVVAANFLIDAESNLKAAIGGFGHSAHGGAPAAGAATPPSTTPVTPARTATTTAGGTIESEPIAKSPVVGHRAEGIVKVLDIKSGTLSIAHGPVESLEWPAMTMDFKAANQTLLAGLQPGTGVAFEFVERSPGEWVITKVTPRSGSAGSDTRPATHEGH